MVWGGIRWGTPAAVTTTGEIRLMEALVGGSSCRSFARGLYDGKGTMMYSTSGDVYSGEWKEGLRHGLGTYVYRKGQVGLAALGDGDCDGG